MEELHKKKIELGRRKAEARKLGIDTPDETPETLDRAEELIAHYNGLILEAGNKQGLQEKTDEQAKAKVDQGASDEVVELKERLARLEKAILAQNERPQYGGLTEEQLIRVLQRANEGKTNKDGLVRSDWIEPDDRLEEAVTFFTPFERDYLTYLPNGGVNEEPPNNKTILKFKNKFRWIQPTLNGPKVRAIATFSTLSKKEVDWVKRHPKFNRTIFLDSKEAVTYSESTQYARLFNKHVGILSNVGDSQMTAMAKEHGIPTSAAITPDEYRALIAELRARDEMRLTGDAEKLYFAERQADKLLLKNHGVSL